VSTAPDSPAPTPESSTPSPSPPERLGPYELLIEVASGGMATVHLARATDRRQGPPLVAIKRPHRHLSGDKSFVTMLVDEARLASAIEHPNVVKVRELGFAGGMPFIVMDYIEGASLAELRRELTAIGRAIDIRVAVRIVLDALAGLRAAHEMKDEAGRPLNIVHRDVSPHNVLIACDGRSHITDFGIAKAEDRIQTTRTHEVKGKLAYLAPERVDKRRICTVQSDVFSMAVVLWECFAGRRLFRGEEAVDVLQEVLSAPIRTLAQIGATIPAPLDSVIARALSRDLAIRYPTALTFSEAIEHAAGPEHIGTHADVARLMEAIFGARMALRQEQVRATIGNTDLADLLRESGLPSRQRASSRELPTVQLLSELAPPAPTERYALGTELRAGLAGLRPRMAPLWSIAAVGGGIAIGVFVTLGAVATRARTGSRVVAGAPAATVGPTISAVVAPRRVIVPLPFAATHVTFDNDARDLDPPADVVSLEVPPDVGASHFVTAVALDGTRAEGYVREEDGVARADTGGYSLSAPQNWAEGARQPAGVRGPSQVGSVHNGFTKLR
jgi:eukaryotic-like serine/threonine-protein kinase